MDLCMVLGLLTFPQQSFTKESFKMEKGMVLESISMLAELVIEETGKMT